MIKELKENYLNYILLFFICSIFGYFYEIILGYIKNGEVISNGIFYGPWLPIYGSGALLISLLNKYRKNPFLIFILSFFVSGLLELLCGFILLEYLNLHLWDYNGWFLNINGFVCFLSALCFGIGGLLIIYLILPLIHIIIEKFNKIRLKNILFILSILFILDVLITFFI